MAQYTKTTWKDRVVEFARRFTKTNETATSVTLTADPGVVTEAGTPVNAALMNKIEQGIFDSFHGRGSAPTDFNTAVNPGSYNADLISSSYTNRPSEMPNYCILTVESAGGAGGGAYIKQTLTGILNTGFCMSRVRSSGTWYPWFTNWNSSNDYQFVRERETSLTSGDLNTIISPGAYPISGFSGSNSPINNLFGILMVYKAQWHLYQEIVQNGGGGRFFRFRDGNSVWSPWKSIQSSKLTESDSTCIAVTGTDLNGLGQTGFYMGDNMINAPSAAWYYVQVMRHNDNYVYQKATELNPPGLVALSYERIKNNGTWGGWASVGSSKSFPDWLAELDIMNDGRDGGFNPTSNYVLGSGIYRFSSLNIPAGVTVTPSGNYVVILVDGPAVIDGLLSASGKGGWGGAEAQYERYRTGKGGGAGGGFGAGGGGAGWSGPNNTTTSAFGGGGGGAGGNGQDGVTETYDGDDQYSHHGNGGGGVAGVLGGAGGGRGAMYQWYPAGGVLDSTAGGSVWISSTYTFLECFRSTAGGGGGGGCVYQPVSGASAGAGGAGGGSILIIARNISGSGAIRADGVNGGNGVYTNAQWGSPGGGGGGGGAVIAVANTITIPTITANGGAPGTTTPGSNNSLYATRGASAGGNGTVLTIRR